MSDSLKKISNSLIYHEQPERFAHLCPERSERIANGRSFDLSNLSECANERFPNPTKWLRLTLPINLFLTVNKLINTS